MTKSERSNDGSTSTTWEFRRVKIRRPPQAEVTSERSEGRLGSLLAWPRKRRLTVTFKYRGGPECWWELEARGRTIRRPGALALHDVLSELYGWRDGHPPTST